MLVLRFKDKSHREWRVPFNLRLQGVELPFGIGAIAAVLFLLASVNLITKQVATISGLAFTIVFFVTFLASERMSVRRRGARPHVESDEFRLDAQDTISAQTVGVRPGNTICLVRDYNTLEHLRWALQATHTGKKDLVVMTIRVTKGADAGYEGLAEHSVFASYEQLLFSRVVAMAEKEGKKVHLLVVPSSSVFDAIVQTAVQLESAEVIAGLSSVMTASEQARHMGEALERLSQKPSGVVTFRIIHPDGSDEEYSLGVHLPRLTSADLRLIHQLWLEVGKVEGIAHIHHRDVVAVGLTLLSKNLKSSKRSEILHEFRRLSRS
jgi:hypothetical protein